MLNMYDTKTFAAIYPTSDSFTADFNTYETTLKTGISADNVNLIYLLLSAKYANSPIANYDESQFSRKLFVTIFQYGPTWIKRLDIQSKLRELTEDDIINGNKTITNHAYNPGTAPSTASLDELQYINDQSTNTVKQSKLNAYTMLWGLLATDVTADFIAKFQPLFMMFTDPSVETIYQGD